MFKLRSDRKRAPHLGAYPVETLVRTEPSSIAKEIAEMPPRRAPQLPDDPELAEPLLDATAMLDALRSGEADLNVADIPSDPIQRAKHLKAAALFMDVGMVGVCDALPLQLSNPVANGRVSSLHGRLGEGRAKTFAAGIEELLHGLSETTTDAADLTRERTAIALMVEHPRALRGEEESFLSGAQDLRSALRASEVAVAIAEYLRLLGFAATAHTETASDVCLSRAAIAAGLARAKDGVAVSPFCGTRFSMAVITTEMRIAYDMPIAACQRRTGRGPYTLRALDKRALADGPYPFERLKRVDRPTTKIDEGAIARVPKRADMFARARFGDFGRRVQKEMVGGHFATKSPIGSGLDRTSAAFIPLQYGQPARKTSETELPTTRELKALLYFLGADAVGVSRCPDWTWYSHDATGAEIEPRHPNAVSVVVDQGWATMEGSSGDDWISYMQSMRAYVRGQIICSVVAGWLRGRGAQAEVHSAIQGDVLQPPLALLSGLGEVSRIGDAILHPFLGPRLKTAVITTDAMLEHDKPIDFGLQKFCSGCNKCARECPSGAIAAGPKVMFNGYEIWKSDSQRCLTYRVTNDGGSMCGRCMKTCPWNLEGLFAEAPFRWAAMALPDLAPLIARLDDAAGRGEIVPEQKWWWDIERGPDGAIGPARKVNARQLQPDLRIDPAEQSLAVYTPPLAPPPEAYPFPADREAALAAYRALPSPQDYVPGQRPAARSHHPPSVFAATVDRVDRLSERVSQFRFRRADGGPMPRFEAGAHTEVVVAPEFIRAYSLTGDPENEAFWEIAVQREPLGRGGSDLMHRTLRAGRDVFLSWPQNDFPLAQESEPVLLLGGGIGITPLIPMAYDLYRNGRPFALHYCVRHISDAALWPMIQASPWASHAHLNVSDQGTRADMAMLMAPAPRLYVCGAMPFMDAAQQAHAASGAASDLFHREVFSVPDDGDAVQHAFKVRIAGQIIDVPEGVSLADALTEAGHAVPQKCGDGICGVCKCYLVSGEVDHRDLVLSKDERAHAIITCRSRAAAPGAEIEVTLEGKAK